MGEARVVDQQQLIRQRLDAFLQRRPSFEQLLELGILGRQDRMERFGLAQQVVNELLRSRLKSQEEVPRRSGTVELAVALERPPPGERCYTPQMLEHLRTAGSLEEKLGKLKQLHAMKQEELKDIQILELLELCACLPPRSRAVPASVPVILQLCKRLGEAQQVDQELRRLEGASLQDDDDANSSWPCEALAAPLLDRFRRHFCLADSDLCRMDKPEWAFRDMALFRRMVLKSLVLTWLAGYLTDLAAEHLADLELWLQAAPCQPSGPSGLLEGLCQSIAREARLFLRPRIPILAKEDSKGLLYHTLQQLVKFHASMHSLGGEKCTETLMKDFDTNRPLEESGASPVREAGGGLFAARLARVVQHLVPQLHLSPPTRRKDVFAAADASFIAEKLSSALGGPAWRPQPVDAKTVQRPTAGGCSVKVFHRFFL
eukprot:Skav201297  [mRNA]  locus=scaffold1317:48463:58148:- [translate_table: standard]